MSHALTLEMPTYLQCVHLRLGKIRHLSGSGIQFLLPCHLSHISSVSPLVIEERTQGLEHWYLHLWQVTQLGSHRVWIYPVPKLPALTIKPHWCLFFLLGSVNRNHQTVGKKGTLLYHVLTHPGSLVPRLTFISGSLGFTHLPLGCGVRQLLQEGLRAPAICFLVH